jgi:hypothetical protein
LEFRADRDILAFHKSYSMRKTIMFLFAIAVCTSLLAQKGNQKNKEEAKKEARETILGTEKGKSKGNATEKSKGNNENKPAKDKGTNDNAIWDGTKDHDGGGPKPSKNQPAKVRSAFAKDYPNATNVSWSKYRGDWTATFNGGVTRSTAVYHANGQRKDTRTAISQQQVPRTIIDIFKKRQVEVNNAVQIEVPELLKKVYRIKSVEAGSPRYNFYDADGKEVKYDY